MKPNHDAHCNADRRKPVGCEMCSCVAGHEIKRLRAALKPIADEVTLMDELGYTPADEGVLLMHATKGGTFMGISFSALRDIKNAYGQSQKSES